MDHPGNPISEGTGTAARGLAELMAALVMALQYYRQSKEAIAASRAHREALERAADNQDRARDASQWRLGLDKGWMRTAVTDEVIKVWAVTWRWAGEDVLAAQAQRMCEERLQQLDPDLMHRYRSLMEGTGGNEPIQAMWQARQLPGPIPVAQDMPEVMVPAPARVELGPAPAAWEAGRVDVPALARAESVALGPAPATAMGPAGWVDAEHSARAAAEQPGAMRQVLEAAATGAVDPDAPQPALGGLSLRQRLAVVVSSNQAAERSSKFAANVDIDRGLHEVRPCGAPASGEPISRPIVAGPGAAFRAVVRSRSPE
jgi:hypothetical protein